MNFEVCQAERANLTKIAMIVNLEVYSQMAKEFSIFHQP